MKVAVAILMILTTGSVSIVGHNVRVTRWPDGSHNYAHKIDINVTGETVTKALVTATRGAVSESAVVKVAPRPRLGPQTVWLADGPATKFAKFLDPKTEKGVWRKRGLRYVGWISYYSDVTWTITVLE